MSEAGVDYVPYGEAAETVRANVAAIRTALARGLRPPPRVDVADWAQNHRKFPAGSPYPGPWRNTTAPYLVEIMQRLSPHDPCEEVAVLKCSQSGATACAENLVGYISDVCPSASMYIAGTFRDAVDWSSEKLWPMIEATPKLSPERRGAILGQNAKSGNGSTKYRVKFSGGGFLILSGSNSAPSLRQHTLRFVIEDDLDQFPDDLDGQGSPEAMVDSRLKVYRKLGLSKRLKISTPTIEGSSKIGHAYENSDKRRYYLKCLGCGSRFDPEFSDIQWNERDAQSAYMTAPCCGAVHENWQKSVMSHVDGWLPCLESEGEKPPRVMLEQTFQDIRAAATMPASKRYGYHITGLFTSFQDWSDLVKNFLAAQGDQNKLKAWTNLDLGNLFKLSVSALDYEKLKEHIDQDVGRRDIPAGVVMLTMGVDVQGDGIYYEVLGWGPKSENWQIDADFLPGATDIPGEGAWKTLDAVSQQPLTFPGGKKVGLDWVCVDAGYHTGAAEAFCKARPRRLAVFGRAGWGKPIIGRGEFIRYRTQGAKAGTGGKRSDDKAYIVGTYEAKLTIYGFLRNTVDGKEGEHFTGRCHFNRDVPTDYFEQLTAETTVVTTSHGYPKKEWRLLAGRQNHYLDCRVYNHAAASILQLNIFDEARWEAFRADRHASEFEIVALETKPQPNGSEKSVFTSLRKDWF